MRRVFFVILFFNLCNSAIVYSFTKNENFYEGEIELKSNEVKRGKFTIDFETDIVRFFNSNGTVDAYSAYNISSILFYDDLINQPRVFVSMNISPTNENNGHFLYEIVKVGKMDILRRAEKNINITKIATLPIGPRVHQFDKKFDYFIYFKGNLIPMKDFMNSVFPILSKEIENDLSLYAKKRNLDLRDKLQPLILIEYFNAISNDATRLAKASVD